jgi:F-type H+-transporting ATPase subunit delta
LAQLRRLARTIEKLQNSGRGQAVAAQKSEQGGLAKRYALALFDLADEKRQLDAIAGDLGALASMIGESADLRYLLRSPLLSREEQGRAMAALVKAAGFSELAQRFIALVAHNRRLFALSGIIRAFHAMLAERRGEQIAHVAAARALTPAQQSAIADAIKAMMGGKVSIEVKVDPALLGGLVVRVGSRMIDSSIRTKLQKMQLAMKGVA